MLITKGEDPDESVRDPPKSSMASFCPEMSLLAINDVRMEVQLFWGCFGLLQKFVYGMTLQYGVQVISKRMSKYSKRAKSGFLNKPGRW